MKVSVKEELVKRSGGVFAAAYGVEGKEFTATIAFTTRNGGYSRPPFDSLNLSPYVGDEPENVSRNRRLVASFFNAGDFYSVNQVHGSKLILIDRSFQLVYPLGHLENEADGFIITVPEAPAGVLTADCLPVVLVAEPGLAAVVHGGWRGIRQGILHNAIRALNDLGARKIVAFLGPCICERCYEVGDEVVNLFKIDYPEAVLEPRKPDKKELEKKKYLSLKLLGFTILQKFGGESFHLLDGKAVPYKGVFADELLVVDINLCTYEDLGFYSYRREKTTGRQVSIVCLEKKGREINEL